MPSIQTITRFLGLSALATLALPALAASNLLVNGDIEAGTLDGWNNQGATATNIGPHAGTWAARFTGSAAMEQTFNTVSGRAYKVTLWLRIVSETGSDWGGFSVSASDYQNWQTLGSSP